MSIKRLANCAAGGTTAIAAAAMFNVAPAHAEGDLYRWTFHRRALRRPRNGTRCSPPSTRARP